MAEYIQLRQATSYYKSSEAVFEHEARWIWQDDAACAFKDPNLFMYDASQPPLEAEVKYREAVAICNTCPVKGMCAEESTSGDSRYTVRAGHFPSAHPRRPGRPKAAVKVNLTKKRKPLDPSKPCSKGHFDWRPRSDNSGVYCFDCKMEKARLNRKPRPGKKVSLVKRTKRFEKHEDKPCIRGHFDWRKDSHGRLTCRVCSRESRGQSDKRGRRRSETCIKGHNEWVDFKSKDKVRRTCLPCKRARDAANNKKRRAAKLAS